MHIESEAWVLYAGDGRAEKPGQLVHEVITLDELAADEVLVAPLYGCWEGNMGHAVERRPIDICLARGEPKVVLGNAGVVSVLEVGEQVKSLRAGQLAIIFCIGEADSRGYPKRIFAYDAPGTTGCLAKRTKLKEWQLLPLPENSRHDLKRWAAFSLRYITAWSNWELALGTYRLLVSAHEQPVLNVWGWGGGVTLAEADLARRLGHRAVMLSANPQRLGEVANTGVTPLNRGAYKTGLQFDAARYAGDVDYKQAYQLDEARFIEDVFRLTRGEMVQIFIDMIGKPVFRATLKALSRAGVVTTSGWKEGMTLEVLRARECIARHQHVHTHYARRSQGEQAVAYAEANEWLPGVDDEVVEFADVPSLAERFIRGKTGMFPVFKINDI